jgi:hypothetical protein
MESLREGYRSTALKILSRPTCAALDVVSEHHLHLRSLLKRGAWRGNEGEADAAHEYRLTQEADQVLRQTLTGDPSKAPSQ